MRLHSLFAFMLGAFLCVFPTISTAQGPERTFDDQAGIARPATVEQRLNQIEQQIQLVLESLKDARSQKSQEAANQNERLAMLEKSYQKFRGRLTSMEKKIEDVRSPLPTTVHKEVPTGTLIINNWTGSKQTIHINGMLYSVSPGTTAFQIPSCDVTAYVPAWEIPKIWDKSNWRQHGNQYTMMINIRNQPKQLLCFSSF